MTQQMTPELLNSITDQEMIGTTRLLPAKDDIPKEYWDKENRFSELVHALYFEMALPSYQIVFHHGFEKCRDSLNRCLNAHLKAKEVDFDHKIAGVAFLLSQVVDLV